LSFLVDAWHGVSSWKYFGKKVILGIVVAGLVSSTVDIHPSAVCLGVASTSLVLVSVPFESTGNSFRLTVYAS